MRVSVALVTYNHAPYVEQALDSVLAQQVDFPFEVEVIVGDDASTDGTRDIVVDYARRYPRRVKPILHPRNVGGPANFKAILERCTGEYVALLDGDDYWTCTQKLQRQVDFLDQFSDCAFCFHNVEELHEEDESLTKRLNPPDQEQWTSIAHVLKMNYIGTASVVYRRELDLFLPPWLFDLAYPDWMLHLSHARSGRIGYLPDTMAVWRIHPGGYWSGRNRVKKLEGEVEFYQRAEELLEEGWHKRIHLYLADSYLKLAKAAVKEGKRSLARASAISAARLNRQTLRPSIGIWLRATVPGFGRVSRSR